MRHDPTPGERMLDELRAVLAERRQTYGPAHEHFARTVAIVNAILHAKLREPLTPADWALVMAGDKLARLAGPQATYDGVMDLAGYACCHVDAGGPRSDR